MWAAVCTRESAPIHWHLRVESGGFKRVQPVLQQPPPRVVGEHHQGRPGARFGVGTLVHPADVGPGFGLVVAGPPSRTLCHGWTWFTVGSQRYPAPPQAARTEIVKEIVKAAKSL